MSPYPTIQTCAASPICVLKCNITGQLSNLNVRDALLARLTTYWLVDQATTTGSLSEIYLCNMHDSWGARFANRL